MICLFESSTCFEQPCAHTQEDNCINTTSGIITLSVLVAVRYAGQDGTHLHTGRPLTQSDYTRSCIRTIVLLSMSTYEVVARNM